MFFFHCNLSPTIKVHLHHHHRHHHHCHLDSNKMKKRACLILVASLLSWVCVTSRPFTSSDFAHQQADQDQNPHPQEATFDPRQGVEGIEGLPGDDENEGKYRGLSRLGSRPPNCEHKCQGCVPCFPVQIPTTTDQIGLQYANYEPEGWKCKCGSTFFNP